MQHAGVVKNWFLGWTPFAPSEVTLAGTPGAELKCPPELIEVTDAGVPLICATAGGKRKRSAANTKASAATVAEFSRSTSQSYSDFATIARPLCHMGRAFVSTLLRAGFVCRL